MSSPFNIDFSSTKSNKYYLETFNLSIILSKTVLIFSDSCKYKLVSSFSFDFISSFT